MPGRKDSTDFQGRQQETTHWYVTKIITFFLFHYRLTLSSTTDVAPAELLLTRRPISHLGFVVLGLKHQQKQNAQLDQHSKSCHFTQIDFVLIRKLHTGATKDTRHCNCKMVNQTTKLNDLTTRLYADYIRTCESGCEDDILHEEVEDIPPISMMQLTPLNAPGTALYLESYQSIASLR